MGRQKYSISDWPSWFLRKKNKWPQRKTHHSLCQETRRSGWCNCRLSGISPVSPQPEPLERSPTCPPSKSEKKIWTVARTCFPSDWFCTRWLRDGELFTENLLPLFMRRF